MPVIVKVRVGSIVPSTCIESMMPTFVDELSSIFVLASCVSTSIFHVSAVPAAADFVGLTSTGLVDPITIVIVVPPVTGELSVQLTTPGVATLSEPHVAPLTETLLLWRLFQLKVLAEGDAVFAGELGKVMTMCPLLGTPATVLKLMVCLATIGTNRTSDPDPAAVLVEFPKNTVVSPADCDEIFSPWLVIPPAPLIMSAESEARNREPLFAILIDEDPAAAFAVSGDAADGREVVRISCKFPKAAACVFSAKKDPGRTNIPKAKNSAKTPFIYSVCKKRETLVN